MDKILEHKIYRNEILKFHRAAEFCFKFKTWNFIAAVRDGTIVGEKVNFNSSER